MRLVFLFMSYGPASEGSNVGYDPTIKSGNRFVLKGGLPTEGYFYMLKRMLKETIIDDLIIFIESNRDPGMAEIDGIKVYVVPEIKYVEDYLKPDDVIFARGGFRTWHNFLVRMQVKGHWLLLYAANTGRARWKFWDIVFDDLCKGHWTDIRKRFFYQFKKPIDPDLFYMQNRKRDFDICIGASHIHDKKSQWKAIDAIIEYQKAYGPIKCIMPGAIKRGVHTNHILPKIKEHGLNVALPGMVSRAEVCNYMNRSKVFIYLGNSGQNDRGPLEALSCGCPVILGGTSRHSPIFADMKIGCRITDNPNDPVKVSLDIKRSLEIHTEGLRDHTQSYFERTNGMDQVVIPEMKRLFDVIRKNPVPDTDALKIEYGVK